LGSGPDLGQNGLSAPSQNQAAMLGIPAVLPWEILSGSFSFW